MGEQIPITASVLRWARETLNYSLGYISETFDKIEEWENSQSYPTYPQLENLANKYKRPLALFFFPQSPDEEKIEKSFRSLPNSELKNLPSKIHIFLRKAKVMQINLKELYSDKNPAEKPIFNSLQFDKTNLKQTAINVRKHLAIDLKEQKKWKKDSDAFKKWRQALEENGIFVFKDSFKPQDKNMSDSPYSGFCLYDQTFPIIYVNNNMPFTRQIFTLFHELAHLLFKIGGVDKINKNYLQQLPDDKKILRVYVTNLLLYF